jgi:hypothetical protein
MSTEKDIAEDVSFVDHGEDVDVQIGKDEPAAKTSSNDDERWARAEAQQNEIRAGLGFLHGQIQGQSTPQNQRDPYEDELKNISEQERAAGIQFEALRASGGLNKQVIDEFDQKARNLAQRRTDIAAQRAIQGALPQVIQAQQQQYFRMQYADVHSNERARQYAAGRYQQLLAEGEPDSPATVDRAMNDSRVKFGMRGNMSTGPTDLDKRQLSGVGGGGTVRGTGSTNVVKMGKAEKSMAMAMYGDRFNGDEKKAYAAWAKGPGVRAKKEAEKVRR